jgi:hypothetical protein
MYYLFFESTSYSLQKYKSIVHYIIIIYTNFKGIVA